MEPSVIFCFIPRPSVKALLQGPGMPGPSAAPAAIAANSENEKTFGKSLIFVALGESIALYGLVISIMILSKLV